INLLTWLGARTSTLRLGTAVIVLPWHNPVLLAEQAATLDLLSGGRFDFGIGKGYRYNEFAGFCVDMDEADARFNECLDVIIKAWTANEPFSHRGHYWQFDNIVVEPPTAQRPHPPIWMGAGGDSSVRQVAERGYDLLLARRDRREARRIAPRRRRLCADEWRRLGRRRARPHQPAPLRARGHAAVHRRNGCARRRIMAE